MKFKIPFTVSNIDKLKKRSESFKSIFKHNKKSKLQEYLDNCDSGLSREEYLAISLRSSCMALIVFYIISTTILFLFHSSKAFILSIPIAILISIFVFLLQILYPKVYHSRKEKNIEKNLIPALNDMYVQLNSGIPLFSIMVNLSNEDYGELSGEFKKAVKKINAGYPEIEVLTDIGERNSSIFLRRTLWQISNGMKAGSDIAVIIKENIRSLSEEQLIQIQKYGNKLNPLIMFYMLISVIIPALSITFFTIISSLIGLTESTTRFLFFGFFFFVVIIQVMFIGLIKSMRPSLL